MFDWRFERLFEIVEVLMLNDVEDECLRMRMGK